MIGQERKGGQAFLFILPQRSVSPYEEELVSVASLLTRLAKIPRLLQNSTYSPTGMQVLILIPSTELSQGLINNVILGAHLYLEPGWPLKAFIAQAQAFQCFNNPPPPTHAPFHPAHKGVMIFTWNFKMLKPHKRMQRWV